MKKTQMWLLVRSNPAKKDSIHYSFPSAVELQARLAGRPNKSRTEPEKTEIHEITVDREECSVALVQSSFSTQMGPSDG